MNCNNFSSLSLYNAKYYYGLTMFGKFVSKTWLAISKRQRRENNLFLFAIVDSLLFLLPKWWGSAAYRIWITKSTSFLPNECVSLPLFALHCSSFANNIRLNGTETNLPQQMYTKLFQKMKINRNYYDDKTDFFMSSTQQKIISALLLRFFIFASTWVRQMQV